MTDLIDQKPALASLTPMATGSRLKLVAVWALRVLLLVGALWLLGWLVGADIATPMIQLIAYTPYVALMAVIVAIVALAARQWREATLAVVVALAFVALILPRAMADSDASKGDIALRVLSLNMYYGEADANQVIELAQELDPDVLSLQEVTAQALGRLERAGVLKELPYSVKRDRPNVAGTALYSRFPFRDGRTLHHHTSFDQAHARATVTTSMGSAEVDIVAAHPAPPMPGDVDSFDDDFRRLPNAPANGPVQILAGDFNATLDHSNMRDLLDTGYRDAAATLGEGLTWSWPNQRSLPIPTPPVTIDHILVDDRAGVRKYSVHAVAGTDHRAVFVELRLPRT